MRLQFAALLFGILRVDSAHHARIPIPVFREVYDGAHLAQAIWHKEQWTRSLEKQLENITQVYAQKTVAEREPFDTLGPQGPPCGKVETLGSSRVCGFNHFAKHEGKNCHVMVIGSGNDVRRLLVPCDLPLPTRARHGPPFLNCARRRCTCYPRLTLWALLSAVGLRGSSP